MERHQIYFSNTVLNQQEGQSSLYLYFKRAADLFLAIVMGLILLLPIILLLLTCGIYKDKRSGLNGDVFTMYKIKTMRGIIDEADIVQGDVNRITTLGKYLRAFGIDEWPQLWNIIKGEMSFIGPRALPAQYFRLIPPYFKSRYQIRPGITGLAQVKGRNTLSWKHKFIYDRFYVKHINLKLDLWILYLTFVTLIQPQNTNASRYKTMKRFTGLEG
jgi:sugar transferase EpsL